MATVDYGILGKKFVLAEKDNSLHIRDENMAGFIMKQITQIVTQLQRINVKVDHAIIRRKISFINRHYRGKLPRDKQELLAKMAAAFM